jgi:ribosomal-protein-alanine N-acetyltransferase
MINNKNSFKQRACTRVDVPALAKILNNKKIWENCRAPLPYPYTEKDAEQFISHVEEYSEQNNYSIEMYHKAAGNISFIRGTDIEQYNAYWVIGFLSKTLCSKSSSRP